MLRSNVCVREGFIDTNTLHSTENGYKYRRPNMLRYSLTFAGHVRQCRPTSTRRRGGFRGRRSGVEVLINLGGRSLFGWLAFNTFTVIAATTATVAIR